MKELINLFIRRPVTVIMILSALTIAAVFSVFSLPVMRLPDISLPRVTVETIYQGMAANEIKNLVTIPLEDGLSPVKGLERMRSVSRDNRSIVSLDFRWGIDPMAASALVREVIDTVYTTLPEGVRKPTVTSGDSVSEPHSVIAINSQNDNSQFARKFAEYELRSRLRRIDGVGSTVIIGGEITEQQIILDMPFLSAIGLNPSEFSQLLAQETADIPAGNAREGDTELVVVSSGRPASPSLLSNIILPVGGGTLKLSSAGEIISSSAKKESVFVYNGKEAAALEIYRRPGADPIRLSRDIKKVINETNSLFSRDVQIELVKDSTPSLVSGITGLIISAVLGAVAVVIILLLFIGNIKNSLLAALSIPVSISTGICIISITGRSLNSMSLCGLAMGIGLVSDVCVVVLDLLQREFGNRNSIPSSQEIGDKVFTISGSSIASTFTTALVFIPIIFLPGPLGSLYGDIAIAIVTCVLSGWIYAQFFLPSLYRLLFKVKTTEKINDIAEKKYRHILLKLLCRPEKILFITVTISIAGGILFLTRPFVFINPNDAEEIIISAVFRPGTIPETAELEGKEISGLVSKLPSIKMVYGIAGSEEEDVLRRADIEYRKEVLNLFCIPQKGIKSDKALADIVNAVSHYHIPLSVYFPKDKVETLLGLSSQRTFVIKGKDRDELSERMEIIQDSIKNSFVSLKSKLKETDLAQMPVSFRPLGKRPELRLYPDRETSAYLSLSSSNIAETLYILNEGVIASRLEIEGRPLDVRVIGKNINHENPVDWLGKIPLRTPQGSTVTLGSIGKIEYREAEASLARLDRSDVIYADFETNKKNIKIIENLSSGFSWFSGADESVFGKYKKILVLYVLLVIILLYMTMGAQFESFSLPIILMMCIPFSLAGAGPALFLSGTKIDSGVILGLTVLFGLVVNNSLILYEISEEKIQAGYSAAAAVYLGACERLRAILITTSTTVIALLPLILSPLGNSQKSMAIAMLGGLVVSTLLSLFAIHPVLIKFFKKYRCRNEF